MPPKKGFGLDLMDRIQNEAPVHQEIIEKIEEITKRNLICYVSFFQHPAATILDDDSRLIETILMSLDLAKWNHQLDLLIHSPGGSPTAAEQIILTCRSHSKSFRVIVAKTAMSAATLVAMGADKIMMSDTSEIGPIDPQMVVPIGPQQATLRPAASFVDAYLELINKTQEAILQGKPPHPYLELLRRIDPAWIQICLKARETSKTIAKEYLKKYMLKQKTEEEIEKIVDRFLKEGEQLAHGRVIRTEKAIEYGLEGVEKENINSKLWNLIWELYNRCENYVQVRRFAKYFVSRDGGVNVKVEAVPLLG